GASRGVGRWCVPATTFGVRGWGTSAKAGAMVLFGGRYAYDPLRTVPAYQENDVRLRLTPREDSFYHVFADWASNLARGPRLLVPLTSDGAGRVPIAEMRRACEHAGDDGTHAIMRRLNESFITPFGREDIHRLASTIDDVMDEMEEAA